MTNDPRDVEAAERAFSATVMPGTIFDANSGPGRIAILSARYAREAAEKRTVEGDLSPAELDQARYEEAFQRTDIGGGSLLGHYRELVRSGWTPSNVEGVDPDLVAVREIVAKEYEAHDCYLWADAVRAGHHDSGVAMNAALVAYRAGKEARQ